MQCSHPDQAKEREYYAAEQVHFARHYAASSIFIAHGGIHHPGKDGEGLSSAVSSFDDVSELNYVPSPRSVLESTSSLFPEPSAARHATCGLSICGAPSSPGQLLLR